ncbi:MAG TPA: hypothetical protein VH765_13905 [Xanthobacteraceae bacterium]|jgi:hypothetical protein
MSKIVSAAVIIGAVAFTLVDLRPQTADDRVGISAGSFQVAQDSRCPKGKRWDYQTESCK